MGAASPRRTPGNCRAPLAAHADTGSCKSAGFSAGGLGPPLGSRQIGQNDPPPPLPAGVLKQTTVGGIGGWQSLNLFREAKKGALNLRKRPKTLNLADPCEAPQKRLRERRLARN